MKPEGWKKRLVRDFSDRAKRINIEGRDLEPLSITKDRGVILQSEKYRKRIATDSKKYVVAEDGDFAFDPMSLYYGAIGRVEGIGEGLISPDYVVFKTDKTIDSDFLKALLRFPEMHKLYESLSETGNVFGKRRRLYWSVFEAIELLLPPIPEQRKIAAVLLAMDHAIEATQAVACHVARLSARTSSSSTTRTWSMMRRDRAGPRHFSNSHVLETGDVGLYRPTAPPNTHWKNWPDGGTL